MALGAGLAVWGVINLLEGYGSDTPAAKSQGIKQLMAGGGVVLIGLQLIPLPVSSTHLTWAYLGVPLRSLPTNTTLCHFASS